MCVCQWHFDHSPKKKVESGCCLRIGDNMEVVRRCTGVGTEMYRNGYGERNGPWAICGTQSCCRSAQDASSKEVIEQASGHSTLCSDLVYKAALSVAFPLIRSIPYFMFYGPQNSHYGGNVKYDFFSHQ